MLFVIDDDAIRRMSETQAAMYTVTASNLVDALADAPPDPLSAVGVVSTVALAVPSMSSDAINKLTQIRQRIVESGTHLMSTEELDNEVAERKRRMD